MIISHGSIDPTRAVGIVSYATAFICSAVAWRRRNLTTPVARLAAVLMLIEGALLVDMTFNLRWKLHQALMNVALQNHEYNQRGVPQIAAVTLLGCLLVLALLWTWKRLKGRGTTFVAVAGAILSITSWCTEVVSLHAVDHILYHPLNGVKVVSGLWILSSILSSVGILGDPR